ncbi:MAG: HemK2/MTQ2 family protein methyltransferase [Halodesulfurarchaeum sp.]
MTDLADRRGLETDVYQPAEDSYLLVEAATDAIDATDRVLDLGTGSGYVGSEIRSATGAAVVASDVNPLACRQARVRGLPTIRGFLVEPFFADTFDVVLFNPPYLPVAEEAKRDDWMEVALTGGENGRAVIDPFVETVGRVLTRRGRVFLVASTLSGLDEIRRTANEAGFEVRTVERESFPFEELVVLEMKR